MKRIRYTSEPIIPQLKIAEQLLAQCTSLADAYRDLEVSQPTYYRWKQK